MANNRLYIVCKSTGAKLLVAKGFGNGWSVGTSAEELQAFMDARDLVSLAESHSGHATTLAIETEYQDTEGGSDGLRPS